MIGFRGRDEGVRHGDDLVARADAQGKEAQPEGVRAVPHPDGMLAVAELGKLLFESGNKGSAGKGGFFHDLADGGMDFILDGGVLGFQVEKRNVHDHSC